MSTLTLDNVRELASVETFTEGKLQEIQGKRQRLEDHISILAPIEEKSRPAMEATLQELKNKEIAASIYLKTGLPCLSMEPLTWRKEQKFDICELDVPTFALYSFTNSNATFVARRIKYSKSNGDEKWGDTCSHHMTVAATEEYAPGTYNRRFVSPFDSYYDDVFKQLEVIAYHKKREVVLSSTFDGLIPIDVKENMAQHLETFRNNIFLLAETEWNLKLGAEEKLYKAPREPFDPLVVGLAGNHFFLIDRFDPTPIEQYIADEFTFRPQLTAGN